MSQQTALITGIAGFAGSFLAENLLAHGLQVSGTLLPKENRSNITNLEADLRLVDLDITEPEECLRVIKRLKPNYIFHLAALASVGDSFRNEQLTYRVNFEGCVNMLRGAAVVRSLDSFVMVSSADSYGRFSPIRKRLTEDQPLRPLSPYGVAKAAAEHACHFYWQAHAVPVIIARAFNHSGPRQTDRFALPSFARQIAEIEAGRRKPVIMVGDLSARRDISDVRDIVDGYRLAATKGKPGESYHLCSGQTRSIESILKSMLKMTDKNISLKTDKNRLRKADIPVLMGSNQKAARELGYTPHYSLKQTLADILDYWRKRVS